MENSEHRLSGTVCSGTASTGLPCLGDKKVHQRRSFSFEDRERALSADLGSASKAGPESEEPGGQLKSSEQGAYHSSEER